MKNLLSRGVIAGAVIGLSTFGLSGLASASSIGPVTQIYKADLMPLNNSGASGTSYVAVTGNQVTVLIQSTGLSANLPHAQHIHIGGSHTCPTLAADSNRDGLISTSEGMNSYGDALVGLTTTGDTSVNSELAVTRYPNGNPDGTLTYLRTFTLPNGVSPADIANGVIVQHGDSSLFNDPTMYDGSAKDVATDPTLPLEATIPVDCAKLLPITSLTPADATMMHDMHVDMSHFTTSFMDNNSSSNQQTFNGINDQTDTNNGLSGQTSNDVNSQGFDLSNPATLQLNSQPITIPMVGNDNNTFSTNMTNLTAPFSSGSSSTLSENSNLSMDSSTQTMNTTQ